MVQVSYPRPMSDYCSPYSNSSRWLRGNLHAHTRCDLPMEVAVSSALYAALGYDFLAITDLDRTVDGADFQRWNNKLELILIPGIENTGSEHILELGTYHATDAGTQGYAERALAYRQAGGFVIGAHPQDYPNGAQNIRQAVSQLHAFEIYNGLRDVRGYNESLNAVLWDEILSDGLQIWAVAVDDFHCEQISPGHGWVCVQIPEQQRMVTWQLIIDQLKIGAFYASTSPAFQRIELEDRLLRVQASAFTRALQIIGPGGCLLHVRDGQELQWEAPANLAYFRIEAVSGRHRAWSQPFYLDTR